MNMGEEQSAKSLGEVIAHANALIQRGIDLDRKLVAMELLMERYQRSHGVALLFSRVNEGMGALADFVKYLVQEMNFQKALVLRLGKKTEIIAHKGFTEAELAPYAQSEDMIRSELSRFTLEEEGSENAKLILMKAEDAMTSWKTFGLTRYLIGHTEDGEDTLFVVAGYDAVKGALYENKYPLVEGDIYWFSQLVLLSGSFLVKMRLIDELKQKAAENQVLAEEREKQIEARTRALLDALFDAKKFRLVIERADMLVALIDSASHRFMFVNTLWEELTGYARDEVVGRKTFEFLQLQPLERQAKLFSPEFDEQIRTQGSFRGSFVYKEQLGGERALSLSLSRFEDDAGGMLYVVIGRDISEDRERSARERSHIEEVEKLNQLMINRELRIIELKRQLMDKSLAQGT